MAAVDALTNDFQFEHIGPSPHTLRNVSVALGVLAMTGLLTLFYWHQGAEENAATAELSQFREAMYNRCGDDQFAGPTDRTLAQLYADSSRMRTAVVKQFHQLQHSNADCADVLKALRSADFPVK